MIRFLLCLTLISQIECLKCYSCNGGQDCGLRFSSDSNNVKVVQSPASDESMYSCSIRVTPEGVTVRDVVYSYLCRSSSSEYCCNENLCNSLLSPPLPALTSLKCAVGTCSMEDGICITDADYLTVLSSATDSCSITFGSIIRRSYKKGCQPTINEGSRTRMQSLKKSAIFCCNSPECNKEIVTTGVADPVIQCYTCDSRITGPHGCTIFNESNPNVYKSGSSSHNEQCATIHGEAGQDPTTKRPYPAFTIRTFVHKCVSKSSGTISYRGAQFHGRIDCCSTDLCNNKNINRRSFQSKMKRLGKLGLIFGIIILVSIVIGVVLGVVINRSRKEKQSTANIKYSECSTNERLEKLKEQHKTTDSFSFPDPSSTP